MGGSIDSLAALETMPIAVTPDEGLSPQVFWASLDYPFPVLVDPGNVVAARYGAVTPDTGHPRRMTTVVDRGGIVLMHQSACPTAETLFAVLRGAAVGISPAF